MAINYRPQYRVTGTTTWLDILQPSGTEQAGLTVTATGLSPATSYDFQVLADNGLGQTAASSILTVSTIGGQTITGVTLSNAFFSNIATAGTTVGTIAVQMTGGTFTGSLSLTGTDATKFAISGSNLVLSSAAGYSATGTQTITDSTGNVWSINNGQIFENGAAAGFSSQVSQIALVNNIIYQYNGTDWYSSALPFAAWAGPVTAPSFGIPSGTYSVNIVVTQSGASGSPFTKAFSITSGVVVTLTAVNLSSTSFSNTGGYGTVVGSLSVATTGGSFTGSYALSGTDAAKFALSGNNIIVGTAAGYSATGSQTITDSANNVWSINNGQIFENGSAAGFSAAVIQIALVNNVIFQYNGTSWYSSTLPFSAWAGPVTAPALGYPAGNYNVTVTATMPSAVASPISKAFVLASTVTVANANAEFTTYTSNGIGIRNARSIVDGIGYNLGGGSPFTNKGNYASLAMNALEFACSRWMRIEIDSGYSTLVPALQSALQATGFPDPNLKIMMLTTAYAQNVNGNGVDTWGWSNVQVPFILNTALNYLDANGNSTLWCIEGPNEINTPGQGGGSLYVDTTTPISYEQPDAPAGGYNSPNSNNAAQGWAAKQAAWRAANVNQLNSKGHAIELTTPSFNGYYFAPWSSIPMARGGAANSGADFGCLHWYAAIPPGNNVSNISLPKLIRAASTSFFGNSATSMVVSEGPIYQPSYRDNINGIRGVANARANALAIMDFFAVNGHRCFFFELVEDTTNAGYGTIVTEDGVTKFASAYVINNMMNLLSLGKNFKGSANKTDLNSKPSFNPSYVGAGMTVTGVSGNQVGDAGNALIMPKADGTTMIAVWAEINEYNQAISSASMTVNFGSSHTYNVYDISGSGGAANMNPNQTVTPYISNQTGSSVTVNSYGMPVFIELIN